MEEFNQINDNLNSKITYTQYGFRSAQKSQSNPESIDGYLAKVYEKFLEEQKLDEQGLKDRISRLKAELQEEKSKKIATIADLETIKIHKENKDKEIEDLQLEKIDIRNGDGELGDNSSFIIGAFITILLTMYLFVFYSSSGYSAFYGIKPNNLGFINPDVFSDAINRGGGVFALIILFPVIFLGLGFLIHNSLEINKKLVSQGKPKTYSLIICLLLITFIADAFIGYKISKGVHDNDFSLAKTPEIWKFNMIFLDINFYLVLMLGFVVYVIWGFLLNYVLSHSYLKTENEKVKLMIENVNNKITDKRKELSDIMSKIHKLDGDIITCDFNIDEKNKSIIGYENGVIPINIASLRGSVGEFMGGWQNYTNGNNNAEDALMLNNNAIIAQTSWLNNKIQNLNTEN